MLDTPRGSGHLLSCAVRSTGPVRTCNPPSRRLGFQYHPAVAPACLTAIPGMRTIALPGEGELLREQSHLRPYSCSRWRLRRFGTHVLLCALEMKWVTFPFRCPISPPTGGRLPMSPQWPTVSAECDHVILTKHFKAPTKASKCGWIAVLYQGEPLREQASLPSGQPLQRYPATPFTINDGKFCV